MKLLFLCDRYYPYIGGAEVITKKLSEYFCKQHSVTVVTKKFKGIGNSTEHLNGVKIYRVANVPRLLHSLFAYTSAKKLEHDADIIISATYASGIAGYWLSKKYKIKSILLVHEILGEHWQYFKKNYLLYYLYEKYIVTRQFDVFVVFSNYTKSKLMHYGIAESKIRVIYHGVDGSIFYPRPMNMSLRKSIVGDAPFVYLYFGRPGGSKGLPYLINAVPAISKALPGSKLVLILSRETRSEYRAIMRMIKRANSNNSIVVLDPVTIEKLPDYINIADTVVIPSLSEGFGFSAAESCMMGKNVVITDTGSLPEVTFGQLIKVQKADSSAIADGIIRISRGEYENVPPKKFTWEKALQKYDAVINELSQ